MWEFRREMGGMLGEGSSVGWAQYGESGKAEQDK